MKAAPVTTVMGLQDQIALDVNEKAKFTSWEKNSRILFDVALTISGPAESCSVTHVLCINWQERDKGEEET